MNTYEKFCQLRDSRKIGAEVPEHTEQEAFNRAIAAALRGPAITVEERAAIFRFRECCEDDDADGHDVPKVMMQRLAVIGLVRTLGFGRSETTKFGDWVMARPPAQAVDAGDLPPLPEMDSLHDIPSALETPPDWDDDYRSTWQKLQVEARNKRQWRAHALELRTAFAQQAAPASAPPVKDNQ